MLWSMMDIFDNSLPRLRRRSPKIEVRFQVRELLGCAVVTVVVAVLVQEAEREELVWTVVVLGIPADGLLGYTDHVAGRDVASI